MSPTSDPIPRTRPGALVLGLGLMVAVAVIGYLLGMIRNRPEPTIARESTIEVRADTRELDALHADLRAMRDELARPRPERDARTPAMPQNGTDARLVVALERLEAAILRLEAGQGQPSSGPRETALIERLDRELTPLNPESATDEGREAVYAWMEERGKELTAHHLLWSIDDVMAAYGRPTRVESDSTGITLHYVIRRLREDFGVELRFQAVSLRIVSVAVTYY